MPKDKMIEALTSIHHIHGEFTEARNTLVNDIGTDVCIPNCGKCCINVPCGKIIEGINVISVLTGQGKLSKILSIAEGWLLEHHKEASTYEGRPIGTVSPKIHEEWANLRITKCPFLQPDLRCMIYDVRPLACRAYGVTYENHIQCPRMPGKGETISQFKYIRSDKLRHDVSSLWESCKAYKPEWVISGFYPTIIYRIARPEKFKALIGDNKIASAKIIGLDYEVSLMWQPQMEDLRLGMSPDLVTLYK